MVKKEIVKNLQKLHQAVEKTGIRITKVILYGSYANGTFNRDSDIDVAIVSPDFGRDRFEEGVALFKIASKIDPRIEPVAVSLNSYQKDTWLPLIYDIREKGVEISMSY